MGDRVIEQLRTHTEILDRNYNRLREQPSRARARAGAAAAAAASRHNLPIFERQLVAAEFSDPAQRQLARDVFTNYKSSLEALGQALQQGARRKTRKNGKKRATRRKQRR